MFSLIRILFVIMMLFGTFSNVQASHIKGQKHSYTDHKHDCTQSSKPFCLDDISVPNNVVVVHVLGAVCSFCSLGIQKKLSKLPFVDLSKYNHRGSLMEIEKQRLTIAIKPGEKANIKAHIKSIYKAVRAGGYDPKRAYVGKGKNKIAVYNAKGMKCSIDRGTC